MSTRIRPPRLGLSVTLATVGGVAGWLSYDLLSNPAIDLVAPGHRVIAVTCTALLGAAAGVLLAPSTAPGAWAPPRPSAAKVAAVMLAVGALAGALIAALVSPDSAAAGAAGGLVCAIPFIPASLLMVAAARRASRARPGSIVARSDRRAVLSALAVALGCASALALPSYPAAAGGLLPPPEGAVLLVLASGILVAVLLIADLVAAARVRRLRSQIDEMETRRPDDAALRAPRVDLGLGDQVAARLDFGATYREGERLVELVIGSADEALEALRRSLVHGAIGLALIEAVGVAHGLARGNDVAASYSAWLCDLGRSSACREAALLAERSGQPDDEAARLHQRACDHGEPGSCLAIELLARRSGPLW